VGAWYSIPHRKLNSKKNNLVTVTKVIDFLKNHLPYQMEVLQYVQVARFALGSLDLSTM
jgi:hypothetical protein